MIYYAAGRRIARTKNETVGSSEVMSRFGIAQVCPERDIEALGSRFWLGLDEAVVCDHATLRQSVEMREFSTPCAVNSSGMATSVIWTCAVVTLIRALIRNLPTGETRSPTGQGDDS